MKKFSMKKINDLKIAARKVGTATIGGYAATIERFFKDNKLYELNESGKQWEIVAFFILGVMQASMMEREVKCFIYTEVELDEIQIDVMINRHPIQLKFAWDDESIKALQRRLSPRKIVVVNAPCPDGYGTDIFAEILGAAGFSEKEIEAEIDENPGFDAAEEVYEWFKSGVVV